MQTLELFWAGYYDDSCGEFIKQPFLTDQDRVDWLWQVKRGKWQQEEDEAFCTSYETGERMFVGNLFSPELWETKVELTPQGVFEAIRRSS